MAAGAEIDLVLQMPGGALWAVDIKRGLAPRLVSVNICARRSPPSPHRSSRAKGSVTRRTMLYKMGISAEQSWRRLSGFRQLGKVIEGVKFKDGIEAIEDSRAVA